METRKYVDQNQPDTELWLGETSSTYGGGTPTLSGAYIAGFMWVATTLYTDVQDGHHRLCCALFCRWLDKLSIAALTHHSRVFRQTFVGGSYSLLDSDQNPSPVSSNSLVTQRLSQYFITSSIDIKHWWKGPAMRLLWPLLALFSHRTIGCQYCTSGLLAPGYSTWRTV